MHPSARTPAGAAGDSCWPFVAGATLKAPRAAPTDVPPPNARTRARPSDASHKASRRKAPRDGRRASSASVPNVSIFTAFILPTFVIVGKAPRGLEPAVARFARARLSNVAPDRPHRTPDIRSQGSDHRKGVVRSTDPRLGGRLRSVMDTGVSMACQTRVRYGEMLLARACARVRAIGRGSRLGRGRREQAPSS
jgi:hypothetical protein